MHTIFDNRLIFSLLESLLNGEVTPRILLILKILVDVPTRFATLHILKWDLPVSQLHSKPCGCKMGGPIHNYLIQHTMAMIIVHLIVLHFV